MATIEFDCPQCGKKVLADDKYRGKVMKCTSCGKGIVIPRLKPRMDIEEPAVPVDGEGGGFLKRLGGLIVPNWLFAVPGRDKKTWIFPRLCTIVYRYLVVDICLLCVVFILLAIGGALCFMFYQCGVWSVAACIALPLLTIPGLILTIVVMRILYESLMLFYGIHGTLVDVSSQLDNQQAMLHNLGASTQHIDHATVKSAQYVCDRLADICDLIKERG